MSEKMRLKNELEQLFREKNMSIPAKSMEAHGEEVIFFELRDRLKSTGAQAALLVFLDSTKVQLLYTGVGQLEGNVRCLEALNQENARINYGAHIINNGHHQFRYTALIDNLKAQDVVDLVFAGFKTVDRAYEGIMKARYSFS